MMQPLDILARGARCVGHSQTAEHWIGSIGQTLFSLALRLKILCGPSAGMPARCHACGSGGHTAPLALNRTTGLYEILCLDAGISRAPAQSLYQYRIDQTALLHEVGKALGVASPKQELRNLGDEIFYVGRARHGQQSFALIAAMSLRTDKEIATLHRRNRQGFGESTGLILYCDPIIHLEPRDGFHSLCSFGTALDFSSTGLQCNASEIRRLLGHPGRPAKEITLIDDVRETLQTIANGLGSTPKGNLARQLFNEKRPDLANVSRSTFFAAKRQVTKPSIEGNSEVQD